MREQRREQQEEVPVAPGEHRAGEPRRVGRNALVQLELAAAGPVGDDADVLVLRLGLVDRALDLRWRHSEQRRHRDRREQPRPAEQERRAHGHAGRGADERPLRPGPGDRHERGDEGTGEAAGGRQRVQPARHLPRLRDSVQREPDEEGRRGPERGHRNREEGKGGEERSRDRAGRDRVEAVQRPAQERPGRERRHRQRGRGHQQDRPQHPRLGPPVGEPPAGQLRAR